MFCHIPKLSIGSCIDSSLSHSGLCVICIQALSLTHKHFAFLSGHMNSTSQSGANHSPSSFVLLAVSPSPPSSSPSPPSSSSLVRPAPLSEILAASVSPAPPPPPPVLLLPPHLSAAPQLPIQETKTVKLKSSRIANGKLLHGTITLTK